MTTKRQHFVPRFYLRHFIGADGMLQVYRRDRDSYFRSAPEGLCAENHLYEVGRSGRGKSGGIPECLRNYIEERLGAVEHKLSPLYDQLIGCCDRRDLESDDYRKGRLAVCTLAANLTVRHPDMLEGNRLRAGELTEAFLATNELTDDERRELRHIGIDDLDMISELAIMQTLMLSEHPEVPYRRIRDAFVRKRMTIIQAPVGIGFITSSMPLHIIGIDEDAHEFRVAYMPLSSKYAALFSTDARAVKYKKASLEEAVQLNTALLANNIWDTAMAQTKSALEIAMHRWLELREAQQPGNIAPIP